MTLERQFNMNIYKQNKSLNNKTVMDRCVGVTIKTLSVQYTDLEGPIGLPQAPE